MLSRQHGGKCILYKVAKTYMLYPPKNQYDNLLILLIQNNLKWKGFLAMAKNTLKAALYARISTYDQHTLPLQIEAMREYANSRGFQITLEIEETSSGARLDRPKREELLEAARQRQLDVIIVWRLDRWSRSVTDLLSSLNELTDLGVAFISITEAVDLTTATGRAMAGLLAVFSEFEREILRDRVKAGIAHARLQGTKIGRPTTVANKEGTVRKLFAKGLNKSEIARKTGMSRTSVRRLLGKNQ